MRSLVPSCPAALRAGRPRRSAALRAGLPLLPAALRAPLVVLVAGLSLVTGCRASVAATPTPTSAAAPAVMTPEHTARLRAVLAAHVSPDGAWVAYELAVPRDPFSEDDGPSHLELHLVEVATGRVRPYITGPGGVGGVQWTPDGKGLAFLDKRGKDSHTGVYVLPVDGGEARRVMHAPTSVSSFAFSPDGQRIAFVTRPDAPKPKKEAEKKGFTAEIVEEEWTPAGLYLAEVLGPSDPFADPTPPEPTKLEHEGHAISVKWSPDGAHLVASIAPTPSVDDQYMKQTLTVFSVAEKKALRRFETVGKLGDYVFSPDGKQLAFIGAADLNDPAEGRLGIGELATGKHALHLVDFPGHVEALAWPTADALILLASEGVFQSVLRMAPSGGEPTVLLPAGRHTLRGLSVAADGKHAAVVFDSPAHPAEAGWLALEPGAALRRLSDSNPWLAKLPLAPQEVYKWKARDGLELEGVLIRPLDGRKSAPLIVTVHGGPESHMSNGWLTYYSYPGQVAAARGFAVFYPNYRGSTGRGVAFAKSSQGDYAGQEFDDILDGIDALAADGTIDPKKVGVTGGSYGGFASAWMATKHTARFAASVMFVGISDQVSKYGTTDIPNEMYLVHSRKWPWKHWEHFRERSPVTYVEQARTPILILHGKNDPRVHPTQSMELFRYLKTIGKVPVRLVLYPGEGHGNRKAAARYDYNLRMLRWMQHYLQDAGGEAPPHALDYSALDRAPKKKDEAKKDESKKAGAKKKAGGR